MIKIGKNYIKLLEIDVPTFATSMNDLYSASTYQKKFNKRTGTMEVKKIKGKKFDADDYKKMFREHFDKRTDLEGVSIDDRVFFVWQPYTKNRSAGHYDVINFSANYKMIEDNLVRIKVLKNDDYRFVTQHLCNHPELTEGDHYIKLTIYKEDEALKWRLK